MIIAVAGKNDIAVNALEYLVKKYTMHDIVVVCNKNEEGRNSWQKSLRYFASYYGVKEVTLESLYKEKELLFLSLEYASIIKPDKFSSTRLYNIHFSLLPKYKGMFTSVMPILNNEGKTGVTLHKIESGIDTGDIIAQREFAIGGNDTSLELYKKYMYAAYQLFVDNIDALIENEEISWANCQDKENSSYFAKSAIDFSALVIDLKQTAMSIHNQIRAYSFRPYQLPQIFETPVVNSIITDVKSRQPAGTVLFETESAFMISTIDYNLIVIKDAFECVMNACKAGDLTSLKSFSYLSHFINEKDEHGWTPLMVATYGGYDDVVEYLLSIGANPYEVNNNGTNLLMYAKDAFLRTHNSKLFELIYCLGVSADSKDYKGKSLRHYCREQNIEKIGNVNLRL